MPLNHALTVNEEVQIRASLDEVWDVLVEARCEGFVGEDSRNHSVGAWKGDLDGLKNVVEGAG